MRSIVRVAFLLCAISLAVARADDVGPHPDLRAIRAALPILLATHLHDVKADPRSLQAPDVVVSGDDAIADWQAGKSSGVAALHRLYGLWWITSEVNYYPFFASPTWIFDTPGAMPSGCGSGPSLGPSSAQLNKHNVATPSLVSLAASHVAPIKTADEQSAAKDPVSRIDCSTALFSGFYFAHNDGYFARVQLHPASAALTDFHNRLPTNAEFPTESVPFANSYYFFDMSFEGTSPVHVSGSALDVWCPFVVDPDLRYTLTMGFVDPAIGPVLGTLRDNVLHFDLPAFTTRPNQSAIGTIDGNH